MGTPTLPSALNSFTSEFDMGSGGTYLLLSSGKLVVCSRLGRTQLELQAIRYALKNKEQVIKIIDFLIQVYIQIYSNMTSLLEGARAFLA